MFCPRQTGGLHQDRLSCNQGAPLPRGDSLFKLHWRVEFSVIPTHGNVYPLSNVPVKLNIQTSLACIVRLCCIVKVVVLRRKGKVRI